MSTCYNCAYSKIESIEGSRFLICGICQKYFCVPFSYPTPDICDEFRKRSGHPILEVITPDEKEKYFEMYRKSSSYNPDISPEEFFKDMDSGFFGIYPERESDERKTD